MTKTTEAARVALLSDAEDLEKITKIVLKLPRDYRLILIGQAMMIQMAPGDIIGDGADGNTTAV